jgi:cell division protein FtsI (penicillin-binding protein 3)
LYGSAVSAPVFHDVAQQVLEYLGVPHDQPVKTPQQMLLAEKNDAADDVPDERVGDLNALFDQLNSLPADDPLRQPANAAAMAQNAQAENAAEAAAENAANHAPRADSGLIGLPEKVLAAFRANGGTTSVITDANASAARTPVVRRTVEPQGKGGVVVDASRRVAVPQFSGAALRSVVETAGQAGLHVQTVGSGLAREQAPAAGTMVPVGTEVVVRFAR